MHCTRTVSRCFELSLAAYLLIYAFLIVHNATLGPIDDHEFLDTIQVGKWLRLYIQPSNGRFYPLDGLYPRLVGLVLSRDARCYYVFNSIELLLAGVLAWKLLSGFVKNRLLVFASCLYMTLMPGFVVSWYRLLVPERDLFVILLAYLYCYIRHLEGERRGCLVIGAISSIVGFLCKETAVVVIGAFSATVVVTSLYHQSRNRRALEFGGVGLACCMLYLFLYGIFIYPKIFVRYGSVPHASAFHAFVFHARPLLKLPFYNPLLFGVLTLLLPRSIWELVKRRRRPDVLVDPMMVTCLALTVFLSVMGLSDSYYVLPLYVFVLPLSVGGLEQLAGAAPLFRSVALIAIAGAVVSSALAGVSTITWWKYVPINHEAMVKRLGELVMEEASHTKRPRIYLDCVNRGSGVELYVSLVKYLRSKGVSDSSYDLAAMDEVDQPLLFEQGRLTLERFSAYRSGETSMPENGDIVVLSPFREKSCQPATDVAAMGYVPIWASKSKMFVPDVSVLSLGKSILLKRKLSSTPDYAICQLLSARGNGAIAPM